MHPIEQGKAALRAYIEGIGPVITVHAGSHDMSWRQEPVATGILANALTWTPDADGDKAAIDASFGHSILVHDINRLPESPIWNIVHGSTPPEQHFSLWMDRHSRGEPMPIRLTPEFRCSCCGVKACMGTLTKDVLTITHVHDNRPLEPCPIDRQKPYSVEIDIPSGKMVVGNFFKELRNIPHDAWHNDPRRPMYAVDSVNYHIGRQARSEMLAKRGYVELCIGNCGCSVYRDGDGLVVLGDEDARKPLLADVCTDVWAYGVVDHDLFVKHGCDTEQITAIIDVAPGRYRCEHHYDTDAGQESMVWTTISRVTQ
jgi:hypothetical protein